MTRVTQLTCAGKFASGSPPHSQSKLGDADALVAWGVISFITGLECPLFKGVKYGEALARTSR